MHLQTYFFCDRTIVPFSFFQLQNAFDNLFEGLVEGKEGEKEAADVGVFDLLSTSFCSFSHSHRYFWNLHFSYFLLHIYH